MTGTIFMVHGMWAGPWCWDKYKDFFEKKGYLCVTPALPYHDVNPDDPPHPKIGTASLIDYADFLEAEIKKLAEPPIIMGHSMGGLLTQILAARGLGKAGILLSPAAPAGIIALAPTVVYSFSACLLTWAFWRKPFKPSFDKIVYSVLHQTPVEDQKDYYKKMVYESGRVIAEIGFWIFDNNRAATVDESKIKIPLLITSGGQDRITPAKVVKKVADKYKAVSTYKEFEGRAHNVIGEPGWEDVAGYVYGWLKGI